MGDRPEGEPSVNDPRHLDHEQLRERFRDRPPGARTVEINGQRYRLMTMSEWLRDPNATLTRWEAFELVALFHHARQYESWWARTFRKVARGLNALGLDIPIPPKKTYLKIPISRIERRS